MIARVSVLLMLLLVLGAAACGTATTATVTAKGQLLQIASIAPPAKESLPLAIAPNSKDHVPEKGPDVGSWYYRSVFQPEGDSRKLYAIEIIYCPTEKLNFLECRTAVAWSRSGKGGLGPQTDAPPSPVESQQRSQPAEPTPPAPAVAAQPPSTESRPEPPAPAMPTNGKGYFTIPAADIARLRAWVKKSVLVHLTYGKTTTGVLRSFDSAGLQIDRSGESVVYKWDEVQGFTPQ